MNSFFMLAGRMAVGNKRLFAKSMLAVLVMTAVQVTIPLVMRDMLSEIELRGSLRLLIISVVIYAGMQLVSNLVSVGWYYILDRLGGSVLEDVRTDMCRAVFGAEYKELMRLGREKLKNIFYMDTINVYTSAAMQSITILSNVVLIIVFLAVSSIVSPVLTAVLFFASLAGFMISMLSRKPITDASGRVNREMKADNGTLNECVDAIELVKTNELSDYFIEKCRKSVWSFINTASKADMVMVFLKNLNTGFNQIASFAVAGFLSMTFKDASAGDLVYCLFVSSLVLETSHNIESAVYTIMKNSASFDNVAEILRLPKASGDRKIDKIRSIRFDDVSFSYDDEHKALSHVSFELKEGDACRLSGGNGKGKSTVLKLISGLIRADSGQILVNGIPINELDSACLRKCICYINQDEILLNGTVKDYLEAISGEEVSEDKLRELMSTVGLDGSVCEISGGGHSLSGGQRKKLLMSKLLLRCEGASVILIDEIEAGLDAATQRILTDLEQQLLAKKKDGIILKISHLPGSETVYNRTISL